MTLIGKSGRIATDVPRPTLRELSADKIDWTLHPAPEPRDVLELTFYELPDAYRDVVAWLHGSRLLNSELLTALRAMTHERDLLRESARAGRVIRQSRQSR
jgi:hypothetical protein